MAFKIIRLEDRIVLDGAGAAVIAVTADHVTDSTDKDQTHSDDGSDHDSTDLSDAVHDIVTTSGLVHDDTSQAGTSILVVSESAPNADELIRATDEQTLVIRYSMESTSSEQLLENIKDILGDTKVDSIAFVGDCHGDTAMDLANNSVLSVSNLAVSDIQQDFWHEIGKLVNEDGHIDLFCDSIVDNNVSSFLSDQIGILSGQNVSIFHSVDSGDSLTSDDAAPTAATHDSSDPVNSFTVTHDTIDKSIYVESMAAIVNQSTDSGADGLDIVLLDTALDDYMDIAKAVDADAVVIFYDSATESANDVIQKVVDYATLTDSSIDSLSIMSHGTTGEFKLGNEWIGSANLTAYADAWSALDGVMNDGGNIYLFGCNVADDPAVSQDLLDSIASATHTDVFASDDITGYGGDWELEASSLGSYYELTAGLDTPLDLSLLADYTGTLAAPTIVSATTVDYDGDGQIDYIQIVTNQNLDDDFSGLTATVAGYTVAGYTTEIGAGGANDNTFYIQINESGSPDTNATPEVTITTNTTLSNLGGENIATSVSSNTTANPPSAYASGSGDDPTAVYAIGGNDCYIAYTQSQIWYDFNVYDSIPDGATINGIEVSVEATSVGSSQVSLSWNAGSSFTSTQSYSTMGTTVLGGSSDTWGHTWSKSELTDTNFRLKISVGGINFSGTWVDYVSVKVYYTASASITAADANDAPVAGNATVTLSEGAGNGTSVHTVTATDADVGDTLTYSITAGNDDGVFAINAATGAITVANNTNLDRETTSSYSLTVQASDGSLTDTATITVNVSDVNEFTPAATDATVSLAENSANGTSVHTVVATDSDATASLTYAITGGNGAGVFAINAATGEITVADNANLDRETYASFALTVTVSDGTYSDTATINVNVDDVNEFTPVVTAGTVTLAENTANGTTVHTVAATDADATASLSYSITGGNGAGVFAINAATGAITVADNTNLDRESYASFSLDVTVSDGTNSDTATITVNVGDVNESAPVATDDTVSLTENSANGTSVHTVVATDADATASLTYAITGGNGAGVFAINPTTGEITVADNTNLDRESYASFTLDVTVSDGTLSDTATIIVNVTDVNDNAPVASDASVSLNENSANATSVHTVVATDPDPDAVLTYAITGGNAAGVFAIDPNTGEITVANNTNLDRESYSAFVLDVTVSDGTNSDTATITVDVMDVNEFTPVVNDATVSLAETTSNGNSVYSVVGTDADFESILTYSITAGNDDGVFTIDANTGEISVLDNSTIDAGVTPSYTLTVQVSDGTNTDTAAITVNINPLQIIQAIAVDYDGDGQIDHIQMIANDSLNDNFTGFSATVDGYTLDATTPYLTTLGAGGANDNTFYIKINESGAGDTNATPLVTITANTTLGNMSGDILPSSSTGNTGIANPTATGDDYNQWNNPTNAYTNDGFFTYLYDDARIGDMQDWYNFNLSIPANAVITGIQVITEGYTDDSHDTCEMAVSLSWDGGASYTTAYTHVYQDSDTWQTTGDSAFTWGRTWTVDELSNANFRVRGEATLIDANNYIFVDVVEIKVYYSIPVTIIADDVNDAPTASNATVSLAENSANGTSVHTVAATDIDVDASLTYAITGGNGAGVFTINSATGEITVADNTNLDRESYDSFALTVTVSDGTHSDTATINVDVTDVSEFAPAATDATVALTENSANGTSVHTVTATDADPDAVLTYSITGGNAAGVFTINSSTGEITVADNTNLDRESYSSFTLTVLVDDGTFSDTAAITVNVSDVNDNIPVAADATVSLAENSANATSVHTVVATDADPTAVLTYAITGGNAAGVFTINANTGLITVADNTNLDRESYASFVLDVTVSDGANSDTATITVNVTDVNEYIPSATDATVSLAENSANTTSVHTVVATDTDPDAVLSYAITGGNAAGVFTINAATGEITVADNTNLDRETYSSFALTVTVSDGSNSDTATITVNVTDVNEFTPVPVSATVSLTENSANGTSVHTVAATDADATATLSYAITGGNAAGVFTIDAATGEITVADNTNLDRESYASFALTVTVSDGTNSDTATITVNVTDVNEYTPVPVSATVSLAENSANGTSVHTVAATDADATATLSYAITGGNAAAIFTINAATGEITVSDNTNLDRESYASFSLEVTVSDGANSDTATITVNVTDVNEFTPSATGDTVSLAENSANGASVHSVVATDADPDATLTYSITNGNAAGVFTINAATGEITVADNTNLDRESYASFTLEVTVSDGTNSDTANITVNVTDVNEFTPVPVDATVSLAENSANGTGVHTVVATDADATASLTYSITNGNAAGVFAINAATGEITVTDNTNLDRESYGSFTLTVTVSDGANSDTATITVNVTDVNEYIPSATDATVSLAENSANTISVHTVVATDTDPDAVLSYAITGGNAAGVFTINAVTGEITVADNTNLDRETYSSFALTVTVSDGANSDTATITVNVTDVNEYTPVPVSATVSLTENSANGTSVHTVAATDADATAALSYAITGGNAAGVFTIDAATGEITVADNTNLDRESYASFALTVTVSDGTNSDTATITVNVTDVNEYTPVPVSATVSLAENSANGTSVHTVAATDADATATLSYAITGGNAAGIFTINAATGEITVTDNTNLDRESYASFSLEVTVSDGANSDTATVTVNVTDVNEFAPVAADANVSVPENAVNGASVHTVVATDNDPTANLTYAITAGNVDGIFTINGTTGEITIGDNTNLDYETTTAYTLTVQVTDGTNTDTATVTVNVTDINESAPVANDATVTLAEDAGNGTSVHTVVAADADTMDLLSYAIIAGNNDGVFAIDAATGEITVADNSTLDRESTGSYVLSVQVSDGTYSDTAAITITISDVNEFAPVAADATVALTENSANGTSVHTVAATDADADAVLTYAITGGNGAGVFTIDAATGEITVADNTNLDRETSSSFVLTVNVSDGTNTDTATITVTVTDVNEFAPVAGDATLSLTENSANGISVHTVTATDTDPDAVLTYAITGGNGAGVFAIDAATGEITVADNSNLDRETATSFVLTVNVSDGTNSDTATITVNVTDVNEFTPVPVSATVSLTENSANGTSVHTVAATDADATAILTYAITGGNGAGVFAIDAATGEITVADNTNLDREAVSSFALTVQVSDGTNTDTATITINVTDVNEFAPQAQDASVFLSENSANGTSVHTVTATDTDPDAVLTYAITGGNGAGVFTIDAATGEITVADNTNLDRESVASFVLTVQVSDGSNSDMATITVNLTDINEFTPVANDATVALPENAANATSVHTVAASDNDFSAVLTYAITAGNTDGIFTIDAATGEITVADNTNLDRESTASYSLTVQVSDGTTSDTATITVNVTDVNDTVPLVTQATVSLTENAPNGTLVHTVAAADPDTGTTLTYAIVGGNGDGVFAIDAATGAITVIDNAMLDREAVASFDLAVQVSDGTFSGTGTITINVADVNEFAPVTDPAPGTVDVPENATNGDHVYTMTATDADPDSVLTYAITGGNDAGVFTIDPSTGEITILDNSILDSDTTPSFTLTLEVSDGANSSTSTVTINISNVDGSARETEDLVPPTELPTDNQTGQTGTDVPLIVNPEDDGTALPDQDQITENMETTPDSDQILDDESIVDQGSRSVHNNNANSTHRFGNTTFGLNRNGIDLTEYIDDFDYSENIENYVNDYLTENMPQAMESNIIHLPQYKNGLWDDIDAMKHEIRDDVSSQSDTQTEKFVASAVTGLVTLVAGYVAWINKVFSFIMSFFTSSPLWQSFDPVPIFDAQRNDNDEDGGWADHETSVHKTNNDKSVDSFFTKDNEK